MKLGQLNKVDKHNKVKNFGDDIRSVNGDIITFFQFTTNLQSFRSRIPDAWFKKVIFSLTISVYLTESENRTQRFMTQSSYYYLE